MTTPTFSAPAPHGPDAFSPEQGAVELHLPSGLTAVIRRASGRDVLLAARHAPKGSEDDMSTAALIALLVRYDGRELLADQALELPLPDFIALTGAVGKGGPTWALSA